MSSGHAYYTSVPVTQRSHKLFESRTFGVQGATRVPFDQIFDLANRRAKLGRPLDHYISLSEAVHSLCVLHDPSRPYNPDHVVTIAQILSLQALDAEQAWWADVVFN